MQVEVSKTLHGLLRNETSTFGKLFVLKNSKNEENTDCFKYISI